MDAERIYPVLKSVIRVVTVVMLAVTTTFMLLSIFVDTKHLVIIFPAILPVAIVGVFLLFALNALESALAEFIELDKKYGLGKYRKQ